MPKVQAPKITRGAGAATRRFTWNRLIWALIFPRRRHRVVFTVPGLLLTMLALGVGTAAYNSANNILFIALSLMLACLILSGVLSWLNFAKVQWRLRLTRPWRAGLVTVVMIELNNAKRFLPTYGVWFELALRRADTQPAAPETTLTAKGRDVRAALARAKKNDVVTRLPLRTRLDPQGEARIEWPVTPEQRGRWQVELRAVGSLFPFGFISKSFTTGTVQEIVVWPAPVEYRRHGPAGAQRQTGEEQLVRAGSSGDLLALRRYASGDSHRLIHWKASARTGQLLVRQFAAETSEGFALWLQTDAATWTRPGQFELCLSLVATLAEDYFRLGRLAAVAIDDVPMLPVRSVHDLEGWLDQLAVLPLAGESTAEPKAVRGKEAGFLGRSNQRNLVTFAPEGARGVAAYVDGTKTASA
jgi:uncharacterized protein (DUF58 family)